MTSGAMVIRLAAPADRDAVLALVRPVIREGTTYTLDPQLDDAAILTYWLGGDRQTFVAEIDGIISGTNYLRANQPGGGAHVCNCHYITACAARGRGVARAMAEHSIELARSQSYRAMQFNFVVSANQSAVRL